MTENEWDRTHRLYAEAKAAWIAKEPTEAQLAAVAYLGFGRPRLPGDVDRTAYYAKRLQDPVVLAVTDPEAFLSTPELDVVFDHGATSLTDHDRSAVHRFAALHRALGQTGGKFLIKDPSYTEPRCPECWGDTTITLEDPYNEEADDWGHMVPHKETIPCPLCQQPGVVRTTTLGALELFFDEDPGGTEDAYKLPRGVLKRVRWHVMTQLRDMRVVVTLPEDVNDAWNAMSDDYQAEANAARWG